MSFKQWFLRWGIKHWDRKKFGPLKDDLLKAIQEIAERSYNRGYEEAQKDMKEETEE